MTNGASTRNAWLSFVLAVLLQAVAPQRVLGTPAAVEYPNEDWIIEQHEVKVRFEDDGRGWLDRRMRVRLLSDGGARQWGQLIAPFNGSMHRLSFREVRILRSDGSVVAVPADEAREVTDPVTTAFPTYSDARQLHLLVPGLRAGDVLEWGCAWTIESPLAPGHFWFEHSFTRTAIVLAEMLEIDVPGNRQVRVETVLKTSPDEPPGRRVYRWAHASTVPDKVDEERRLARRRLSVREPDVVVSSFPSWDAFGAWFAALERERRAPTPEIRDKALALTSTRDTKLARVEALYEFVATQIRYVSVSLGQGAVQPHAASETLRNGYGDCKDKHTLLAALLASIDIPVHTALVSALRDSELGVPYLQFDHVVSAVPWDDGYIWLDTTSEVGPFRWLAPTLRAKQALLVAPDGATRVVTMPADSVPATRFEVELDGDLGADGVLSLRQSERFQGDAEVPARMGVRILPRNDLRAYLERAVRAAGNGSPPELKDSKVDDPLDTRGPFTIEAVYTIPGAADPAGASESLPLPGWYPSFPPSADLPLDADGHLSLQGRATYRWSANVRLPPGWSIAPGESVAASEDFAEYQSRYRFKDGRFEAERVLEIKARAVPHARGSEIDSLRALITQDLRRAFLLRKPEPGTAKEVPDVDRASCDGGDPAACVRLGAAYAKGSGVAKDEGRAASLYQRACDGGDATGCGSLGHLHETGRGVAADLARAADLYAVACERAYSWACLRLGSLFGSGSGVGKNETRAAELFRRACDGGNANGCSHLGFAYEMGRGVEKDFARAFGYYKQACEGDDGYACTNLGSLYEHGRGVAKDDTRAAEFFRRGCDAGNARGCSRLGTLHEAGRGVERDLGRAIGLHRQACDGNDASACTTLGSFYEEGEGVGKDEAMAAELYRRGCDGGDPGGCRGLGYLYEAGLGVEKDVSRAALLYARACEAGESPACTSLGYLYREGEGVAQDESFAASLFKRACEANHAFACRPLGFLHEKGVGVTRDVTAAAALYRRGCDGRDQVACSALARLHAMGLGVERDYARARELFDQACTAGHAQSCVGLAVFYQQGLGVEKDPARARELFKRGCDAGVARGCTELESLPR